MKTNLTPKKFELPAAKLCFPVKYPDADKIKYGRTLVIAGSKNIYGAAFFAAKSALMSGAGMVRVITHIRNRLPLTRDIPEAMFSFYGSVVHRKTVVNSLNWADTVVAGPGLSAGRPAHRLLELTLKHIKRNTILVLDADALNVLSRSERLLKSGSLRLPMAGPKGLMMPYSPVSMALSAISQPSSR